MTFRFQCRTCSQWHEGMPALCSDAPLYYYSIPEAEREARCYLDPDICIVDDKDYFLRSNILVPVHGLPEPMMWGVWVSVSEQSYDDYLEHYEEPDRASRGPYFGWLAIDMPLYPFNQTIKTRVFPQEPGIRPRLELEPTDYPLAVEQRLGISQQRLIEIYEAYLH